MDLPGHGEAVPGVKLPGYLIARGRGAVEEPDAVLPVVYSVSEDVDDASAAGLPVEPSQEPLASVGVSV